MSNAVIDNDCPIKFLLEINDISKLTGCELLCCAMLCCTVLCCAVLCYAVLCYAVLC